MGHARCFSAKAPQHDAGKIDNEARKLLRNGVREMPSGRRDERKARRNELDFKHLQPFGSVAFPILTNAKTTLKQPIFVDKLLTSFRDTS